MRVIVNLATRPFVELRPFFLRLRIMMAALVVAAIALGLWAHALQGRLNHARAQMDVLSERTTAAQQEKQHAEARMRQPANAAVLDRAHFLNTLFLRKSFSWTAVMMDLENVLPSGVQVTAIEPQVTATGDVIIRLRVSGERERAVQLVRNLERSKRFLEPRLSGESTQSRETGTARRPGQTGAPGGPEAPAGVQFDILANYNPLPADEPYPGRHAVSGAAPERHTHTAQRGLSPAANARHGYPRDGVVLKPHSGASSASSAASPAPLAASPAPSPPRAPGGAR